MWISTSCGPGSKTPSSSRAGGLAISYREQSTHTAHFYAGTPNSLLEHCSRNPHRHKQHSLLFSNDLQKNVAIHYLPKALILMSTLHTVEILQPDAAGSVLFGRFHISDHAETGHRVSCAASSSSLGLRDVTVRRLFVASELGVGTQVISSSSPLDTSILCSGGRNDVQHAHTRTHKYTPRGQADVQRETGGRQTSGRSNRERWKGGFMCTARSRACCTSCCCSQRQRFYAQRRAEPWSMPRQIWGTPFGMHDACLQSGLQ